VGGISLPEGPTGTIMLKGMRLLANERSMNLSPLIEIGSVEDTFDTLIFCYCLFGHLA